jgi:predicted nucleic acid-binding protein
MILADTSVWVDHFRRGNARLQRLLEEERVACHPFVIGELACGLLHQRESILDYLARLPQFPVATHAEALGLVQARGLAGTGLGWIDVHLLAAALLARGTLWTLDRPLHRAAGVLRCAAPRLV